MPTQTARTLEADRRRSPRQPHVMEAWISSPTAKNQNDRVPVTSIDLSRHGVAFDTTKPFPIDAYFKIEIGLGAQKILCEVKTISCRQLALGAFHVGAEFH